MRKEQHDCIFHFLLALAVILAWLWLVSYDRQKIRIRYILQLIIIEIALAFFFLHAESGLWLVKNISGFCFAVRLCRRRDQFRLWRHERKRLSLYFPGVLCPIVFISALIGILQHWRILPIFIRVIGTLLSKVNGMGKLESFNAVSSLILGQSENFIAYKGVLGDLSSRRLFTMAATAMSTVSLSIVGAYMTMLDAKYVVAALILNMFSTFIVLSVINPTRPGSEQEIKLEKLHESQSFFEMLGEYILAGFKVAMIILAMLIGFIALISAINALFATLFGLSFQQILGYVFYPLAWLIGIPLSDALNAGSIMATKLVANEFVAMIELQKIAASMTPRGLGILSVFLVSFANFASIGIIAGAIKGLNEPQGNIVSRFGLRLVYSATLVSLLSASFAGLVL